MDKLVKQRFTDTLKKQVLDHYRLDPKGVTALDGFESFIFEAVSDIALGKQQPVILRVGHSGRRNANLVQAEIDFINYLADNGMSVARALPSPSGKLVEAFDDGHGQEFIAVMFRKLTGKAPEDSDWTDDNYVKLGKTIGKMHALTKAFRPQSSQICRPQWNDPIMHEVEENLTIEHQYAIDKYNHCMEKASTFPTGLDDYGLVHFDVHEGNFFLDKEGQAEIFDFDDSHYTWFANDIAIVLYYIVRGPDTVAFVKRFMPHFLTGYAQENSLDPKWLETIPMFLKMRQLDLFALIHRSFDTQNLDPSDPNDKWCINFLKKATPRIKNDLPVIDYDFTNFSSCLFRNP